MRERRTQALNKRRNVRMNSIRHLFAALLLLLTSGVVSARAEESVSRSALPGWQSVLPNESQLYQRGQGNGASFWQRGLSSLAEAVQKGDQNGARITQAGDGNLALIGQLGRENSANVVQAGSNNSACVVQIGRGLATSVVQNGDGQSAGLFQSPFGVHEVSGPYCAAAALGRAIYIRAYRRHAP